MSDDVMVDPTVQRKYLSGNWNSMIVLVMKHKVSGPDQQY